MGEVPIENTWEHAGLNLSFVAPIVVSNRYLKMPFSLGCLLVSILQKQVVKKLLRGLKWCLIGITWKKWATRGKSTS